MIFHLTLKKQSTIIKNLPLFFILILSFLNIKPLVAKEIFKLNGESISSEQLSSDAYTFLSQNINPAQVEEMDSNQAANLAQSILVKKFLIQQASQDNEITKQLEQGGALNDAINRVRIDIISQAYLDKVARGAVNDEMINKQYQSLKQELENAIEYELQVVITSNRQDAERARVEIVSGELFSEVASKYSIEPQSKANRGNLGKVLSIQLAPDLQDALQKLRVYELSDVVQVGENFTIARYTGKSKPNIPDFAEISDNLKNQLIQNAKQQLINQIASQIKLEPISE